MEKTVNSYGAIQVSKELMLLKLLLTYWGKKGMHIKRFFSKEKYHRKRYQELHHFKQSRKGVLLDHPENIKAPIASL